MTNSMSYQTYSQNLSMPENSVIQQDHFVIFNFDRSCKGGISNNLVF